jgi:long-chain acyl-CoA synthetase
MMLFHSLIKTAGAYADKTALVLGSSRITYAELLGRVARFMDRLRAMNVGEGDCIALVMPNSIEFVVSFYALAGLRVIALPLNPSSKVEELKYYLTDNEVKGIITNAERSELCRQGIRAIEKGPALIIADESNETITLPQDVSRMDLDATHAPFDGPVIYQYSSGSTGRAKKVCRTQRNLAYETEAYIDAIHMTALDTVLCVVPLFHAHGLGKCMLAPVTTGATLVMLEPVIRDGVTVEVPFLFRTQRVFELIKREKVTILPATPYISGALAETPEDVQVDVSTLRLCLSGGNFLPDEVFTRFKQRFGIPLRSIYGSTETGSVALNMEPDEVVRFDSVGRPSGNIEVRITNGTLEELPAGSIGEIAVKSEAMAGGYLNMPELNREVFRDGFYFTGDLGKKDEQGRLYITGRKKIFIESGGEKVDPLEIEQVLQTHPAVKEAAVVGIAGPYGGQAIKAVIVLNNTEGAAKNLASMELEILLHCKERLSDYKIPRVVEFREALPKSSLGKILRKDLIDGSDLPGRSDSSPAGDNRIRASILALEDGEGSAEKFLEARIREQLATMLKVDIAEIDARRPLGEFGLGSLMAVELRNWLEASLELALPVTILWSYPTARDLAPHLVAALRRSINLQSPGPVDVAGEQASGTKNDAASLALAEIERLSEAEVRQQIETLTREDWKDDRGGSVRNTNLSSYASQIEQMSDAEIRQLLTRAIPEGEAQREVEK